MYLGKDEGRRAVEKLLANYLSTTPTATYKDIAENVGVHERTLYKWLSGHTRVPMGVVRLLELMVAQKSV
jgi:DNA invertase Pin-like site-specific DNA recombinase